VDWLTPPVLVLSDLKALHGVLPDGWVPFVFPYGPLPAGVLGDEAKSINFVSFFWVYPAVTSCSFFPSIPWS